jgi:uncharacterized protein YndB with AHSA1/START domain
MTTASKNKLTVVSLRDREILVTRRFDAPRKLVFEALTQEKALLQWFGGPPGWTLAECKFTPKKGTEYRYVWRKDDGTEMGMGGTILEIDPPKKIVTSEHFDQSWYPGDAVGTIELEEEGDRTLMKLTVRYESQEARDMVLRSPMESGMAYGYDRLENYLAGQQA